MARSLFQKGADFTAAMAFMLASTNLVIELGLVLWIPHRRPGCQRAFERAPSSSSGSGPPVERERPSHLPSSGWPRPFPAMWRKETDPLSTGTGDGPGRGLEGF